MALSLSLSGLTVVDASAKIRAAFPAGKHLKISTLQISGTVTWDFTSQSQAISAVHLRCFLRANLGSGHDNPYFLLDFTIPYATTAKSGSVVITGTKSLAGVSFDVDTNYLDVQAEIVVGSGVSTWTDGRSYYDFTALTYTSAPAITAFTAQRSPDDAGTGIKVSLTYAVAALSNYNTKALVVRSRELGAVNWSADFPITITGYTGSIANVVISGTFDATKQYEVQAALTDVQTTSTGLKIVSAAAALLHLSADKLHVAIGKFCEAGGPGFDVAKDVRFRSKAVFDALIDKSFRRFAEAACDFAYAGNGAPFGTGTPGGGSVAEAAGETNHPGVVTLKSGTANPSGYTFYAYESGLLLAGGETLHAIFNIVNAGNLVMRIGFCDAFASAGASVVDGVYINVATGGVTTGKSTVNGATGTTPSSVTLAIATWYHAVVAVESASLVRFTIYNEAGAVVWTDTIASVPTGAGRNVGAGIVAMRASTTAGDLVKLDYLSFTIDRDLVR